MRPISWLSRRQIFASANLTIRLGRHRLDSHNDHAGLGNNLFLFCLVDVPCQRRDQQGGQNSQDDQNDNQLNKRKAFFSFYICEHTISSVFLWDFSADGLYIVIL